MNRLHRHLHLQHHRHTGKKLHHQHTSYRGLAIVFVAAGAMMLTITALGHATADSFSVGATVRAPIPSSPAIIDFPAEGDAVTSDSQVVTGSCPIITPQVVIAITLDNVTAGSAICDSANDFSLPLRLAPGAHTISAQALTITGDPGPTSSPVHVTYKATALSTSSTITSQPNGITATSNPLVIAPQGPLLWLGDDKSVSWSGSISGGTPPYRVLVDWGDGSRQTLTQNGPDASFDHVYTTLQPYNMSLSVTDAAHVALHEQFAVASYATSATSLAALGSTTTNPQAPFADTKSMLGLYGLYVTALAVFGIVWLEAKHAAVGVSHVT